MLYNSSLNLFYTQQFVQSTPSLLYPPPPLITTSLFPVSLLLFCCYIPQFVLFLRFNICASFIILCLKFTERSLPNTSIFLQMAISFPLFRADPYSVVCVYININIYLCMCICICVCVSVWTFKMFYILTIIYNAALNIWIWSACIISFFFSFFLLVGG